MLIKPKSNPKAGATAEASITLQFLIYLHRRELLELVHEIICPENHARELGRAFWIVGLNAALGSLLSQKPSATILKLRSPQRSCEIPLQCPVQVLQRSRLL